MPKYEFAECLGDGAIGRVWRAVDEHGRSYAIKFFTSENPWTRENQALAHASALMRVHDPGIVQIIAVQRLPDPDSKEPELAIVMEHLVGIDLAHFRDALSIDKAREYVSMLTGGLEAIHKAGLVHGDLHAGNIFITSSAAKILDIPYEKTIAGMGTATGVRSRSDDVRSFARVVRALLEHVPGLEKKALADCYYRAEQAETPREVANIFSEIWQTAADGDWLRSQVGTTDRLYLVTQRLTRHAAECTTYVVVNGQVIGTVPNLLFALGDRLLTLRDPGREVLILRQSVLERWLDSPEEPQPSDYETHQLAAPCLSDIRENVHVELAGAEPTRSSREMLFTFERSVAVKGFLGPYLFVEQLDYKYGGGAHPDSTCIGYVVDARDSSQRPSIFEAAEHSEILAREGLVARESFLRLRDSEPLLQEVDVSLVAAYPTFEIGESEAKLRLVFTTFTAYMESEFRWASYTQAEELPARVLPELLKPFADLPEEITRAMRMIPGVVIGWSALNLAATALDDLSALLADQQVRTGYPGESSQPISSQGGPVLPQHNLAAPWRSPYHGKTDLDIALEVADVVARASSSQEMAIARFVSQLSTEFITADRELSEMQRRDLEAQGIASIKEFFSSLPNRQP